MATYASAFDAICQSCGERFRINEKFISVINLDIDGFDKNAFLNGDINKTQCPHCRCRFTYEIPMIIFSIKNNFAIKVMPDLTDADANRLKPPPYIIMPKNFRYRLVRYLTEAREKYDIFMTGLDDTAVEYIKLTKFTDIEAMPFDEKNIIFHSEIGGVYTFYRVDYNDTVTDEYKFYFNSHKIPDSIFNLNQSHNKWLKIDRETLKELTI